MTYPYQAPPRLPPARFNPKHDPKSGQFATGHGASTTVDMHGWVAGNWTSRQGSFADAPTVYSNGRHVVTVYKSSGMTESQVQAVLDDVDHLQAKYPLPHGPLRMKIVGEGGWQLIRPEPKDKLTMGFAFMGTSEITLRGKYASRDQPEITSVANTWKVPVTAQVPAHTSLVTHEWGHVYSTASDSDRIRIFEETGGAPSDYGKTNEYEAEAESFVEWSLTEGKTTYLAAKMYARKFGWP